MSPRLVVDAFADPSNTANSRAQSVSRKINFYLEAPDPGHARAAPYPIRRPGLHPFAYLGTDHVRGVFEINDRMFAVAGAVFAEVLIDGSLTHTGTVATDNLPVSWASNGTDSSGHQIFLVSAGLGYIYDLNANTLMLIADADFPANARCAEYLDGYFLVSQGAGSRRVQWSALLDGTSWDALDFLIVSTTPDSLTGIIRNHKEIWAFGYRNTQVLVDSGDVNDVFVPYQGVVAEMGSLGIFTMQRLDNTIFWLLQSEQGVGMVMRAEGYVPKRVSTFAVEVDIQKATYPVYSLAFTYQMNGHFFYVLQIEELKTAWVYDVTMSLWTEWAHWDTTACEWVRFLPVNHTNCFFKHLVGSRSDGTIYEMSQDFEDDHLNAV